MSIPMQSMAFARLRRWAGVLLAFAIVAIAVDVYAAPALRAPIW